MNEMLILGGILAAVWLALMYMRVPSSIAFLSILIGQLLSQEAGANVYDFVTSILQINEARYLEMALLLLPLLLTVLFLRNHVPQAKLYVEAVPLLLVSALTLSLLGPLIPELNDLMVKATDNQIESYKSIIVVASTVSALLSAWLSYPKISTKKKH